VVSRAVLVRVLPFAIYMAFIAIADLLTRIGMNADSLRWLYPVKIALVSVCLVVFWKQYDELRSWQMNWRTVFTAGLAGLLVLWLWVHLDASWMSVGKSAGFDPRDDGQLRLPLVIVRLIGGALVVPIMEELFWRSFLMRWIVAPGFEAVPPAHINLQGFVVTVILFGVEHNLWLAGMVAGAIYSLLYMRSGKLWSPIMAHAVTNGGLGIWILATGNWSYW